MDHADVLDRLAKRYREHAQQTTIGQTEAHLLNIQSRHLRDLAAELRDEQADAEVRARGAAARSAAEADARARVEAAATEPAEPAKPVTDQMTTMVNF